MKSKVLILGTMPGVESLKQNEYYAYSRNAFWKIVFSLFDQPFSNDYHRKQSLLLENNIALWDILKACERKGSLDTDILEEVPNELPSFFLEHPQIKHVFFNGKKAHDYFFKYIHDVRVPHTTLPSTSPAHTLSFEKKLKEWTMVKQVMDIDLKH